MRRTYRVKVRSWPILSDLLNERGVMASRFYLIATRFYPTCLSIFFLNIRLVPFGTQRVVVNDLNKEDLV